MESVALNHSITGLQLLADHDRRLAGMAPACFGMFAVMLFPLRVRNITWSPNFPCNLRVMTFSLEFDKMLSF